MLLVSRGIACRLPRVAVGVQAGLEPVRFASGTAMGAAFTNRRVLQPLEARLILITGFLLLGTATLLYFFPQIAGYGLMVIFGWIGVALTYRASKLYWKRKG